MPGVGESELGSAGADHDGQSRRAGGLGQAQLGLAVQRRRAARAACRASRWTSSYSRRWWGNFFVTHNRALGRSDYDEVTLTAPRDPRLPGGGGYPVTFLTRNNNSVLGVTDRYYTTTSDFGDETHYWHGVDFTLNARMTNGLQFQGGTSTGRGVNDTCDVLIGRFGRPMTPEHGNRRRGGRHRRTAGVQRRRTVAHHVPRPGVVHRSRRSTCWSARSSARRPTRSRAPTSAPTAPRASANFLMTRGAVPGRHRPPAAHRRHHARPSTCCCPEQLYGDRVNNLDMRVAKILRIGRTRANVGVDLYNLTNANTATTFEATYDPADAGRRGGCGRRRCCSRGSCGSTCSSISEPRRSRRITKITKTTI